MARIPTQRLLPLSRKKVKTVVEVLGTEKNRQVFRRGNEKSEVSDVRAMDMLRKAARSDWMIR